VHGYCFWLCSFNHSEEKKFEMPTGKNMIYIMNILYETLILIITFIACNFKN